MSKVDWSKAPEGAEFYAAGKFRKIVNIATCPHFFVKESQRWCEGSSMDSIGDCCDFEYRPMSYAQWPEEGRIDIIGTNGNTAEHYMDEVLHQTTRKHYETQAELAARIKAELEAKQKAEIEAKEKAQAKPQNKYDREIIGKYGSGKCIVDVYRVLVAFGDIPPEIQHAIKKLLAGGKRGHKDEGMDYLEAIQSIEAYLNRLDDSSDQCK